MIGVIYLGWKPNIVEQHKDAVGYIDSVARFRGLEIPIVIIYAAVRRRLSPEDDLMLACAYARATTRCIAIFDIGDLPPLDDDTMPVSAFSRQLFREQPDLGDRINQLSGFPSDASLIPITRTAQIGWSSSLYGWVIKRPPQSYSEDELLFQTHLTLLWTAHLSVESHAPVFVQNSDAIGQCDLYCSPLPAVDPLIHTIMPHQIWVTWCDACQRLTPTYQSAGNCLVCIGYIETVDDSAAIPMLRMLDGIAAGDVLTLADKSNFTPYIAALRRIHQLTESQRATHLEMLKRLKLNYNPTFQELASQALVALALTTRQASASLEAPVLAKRTYEYIPWLHSISLERWEALIRQQLDR